MEATTLIDIIRDASFHVLLRREPSFKPFRIRRLRFNERRMISHKLFYSWKTSYWFVALQDEKSGRIITVHPVHFQPHKGRVKPDDLVLALARSPRQLTYQRGL